MIDTHHSGKIPGQELEPIVRKIFPLTPKGIIEYLKLRRPIFAQTAAYGHFGRKGKDFTWEAVNKAEELKSGKKREIIMKYDIKDIKLAENGKKELYGRKKKCPY